jgi:hypothetical protein
VSTCTQALLLAIHESNVHGCVVPAAGVFGTVGAERAAAEGTGRAGGGVEGFGVNRCVALPALRSAELSCVLSAGSLEHPTTAPRPARVRVTTLGGLSFIETPLWSHRLPFPHTATRRPLARRAKFERIAGMTGVLALARPLV